MQPANDPIAALRLAVMTPWERVVARARARLERRERAAARAVARGRLCPAEAARLVRIRREVVEAMEELD